VANSFFLRRPLCRFASLTEVSGKDLNEHFLTAWPTDIAVLVSTYFEKVRKPISDLQLCGGRSL